MKTVLDLTHIEAKEFFLKQENYCSIDLPNYFDFQPLLDALASNGNVDNINLGKAKKFSDINYTFYTNKDGKLAWRPLQIINPVIYANLVNKITQKNNWELIVNRFNKFQKNEQIQCFSIPLSSSKNDKAETITNWWQQIEQQSIELALDFNCFMNTDISECYSSIYTHSIPWALHGKEKIKEAIKLGKEDKSIIGYKIDLTIQSMQYAQTNGIPQGSVLMDFIAEMILGYADKTLSCKINKYNHQEKNNKIDDYKILRYRDDYRIFASNQQTVVKIGKLLSETLTGLNLKLNTHKTFISENIVSDVIKPDKLYWNASKQNAKTLQKRLLLIHSLAEKHPNSGSLVKALTVFLEKQLFPLNLFKEESSKVLVSILIDIAFKNPKTYPVAVAILSKIISLETNNDRVNEILNAIEKKFENVPNVGHLQIWLQRLTLMNNKDKVYTEKLCKKVVSHDEEIWNMSWVNQEPIKNILEEKSIINHSKIEELEPIIQPNEVSVFSY